jgi:inhibitor of cysteine peptidase
MRSRIILATICLMLIGVVLMALQCSPSESQPLGQNQLRKFSSYEELVTFLKASTEVYPSYPYTKGGMTFLMGAWDVSARAETSGAAPDWDYSTTNIQVEGVDEADIIKTDGKYIYLVSENRVIIVKAYPPEEAQVLSEIELDQRPEGLFINGDRLVVLYQTWGELVVRYEGENKTLMPEPEQWSVPQTYIKIYDVSDRESPVLKREVAVDGQYFGSRMIGDYIYAVVNEWVYEVNDEIKLPEICFDDRVREIPATDIYYPDISDSSYGFTTIVAINTQRDDQEPAYETILLGATSSMYVSLNNIYITFTEWRAITLPSIALPEGMATANDSEKTTIHRIHIEDGEIEYNGSGEVPGRVLDQFSMDEYQGYFRIATTTGNTWEATSQNNLYILDTNLEIVASLEGLAPGEQIYSARFMGDRCYLVTFRQIDPLFVIDLEDPYNPEVLGQLKITGYSDYLHPYDETHVLGIGKETVAAEEEDFAWYQGVKISLFDVSDVAHPVEIAKYEIGDRGTDSPVLSDHKALLFDKTKNLLVIPVLVAEIDEEQYPYEVPPYAYGEYVWQGAYVFNISLDEGLELRGRITHCENFSELWQKGYYYDFSTCSIERSLYIGDVLYTISEAKVKMNSLENLAEINEVEL